MLKVIGLFTLLISANVFAQRLYVHDMLDGNYQSYQKDSRIVLFMLDSTNKISGTITQVDSNAFYLKGGTYIRLDQIASILPPDKSKSVKRFFGVMGGLILVTTGTIYFIAGAASLKEEPVLGAGVMVASAGAFTGGIWLLRHSKKAKKQVKQQLIDNKHYRIYVE